MSLYTVAKWLCRLSSDQWYKVWVNENAYTRAYAPVTW
jgi:hypothetical protein